MPETPAPLPPPRSSYLHVPFCARRCGYCNFAVAANRLDLADDYLRAIELELARGGVHEVDTLYFGGGTPTQLAPSDLRRLGESTLRHRPLATGGEWTVEANPADVTAERVAALPALGATRMSLGAQSLNAEKLVRLERDHQPDDVHRAVALARQAGLGVAIDLIFAAPEETLDAWIADVDAVLRLGPQHISTYGLTYERGAAFWGRRRRGALVEAPDELQREMYIAAIDRLTAAGYEHYEVSNFARPGRRSRHNEAYWCGDGYFAEGPGAARYIAGVRETNHRSATTYLRRVLSGESPVAECEVLTPEQRARERLVFGLRRLEGVERESFAVATGFAIEPLAGGAIRRFVEHGMLEDDGARIRLTREGLMISDALWPELL